MATKKKSKSESKAGVDTVIIVKDNWARKTL